MTDRNMAFIADLKALLRKLELEKFTGNFIINVRNGEADSKLKENTVIDLAELRRLGAI
tara:strand:+ start:1130 stop:1306 length:177 start_codon:yes stop_codon:yes gene_type:complete